MTSVVKALNVPPADPSDKEHFSLGTGRVHPSVRRLIDRAALDSTPACKRNEFILTAAIEKAITVLGEETAREILEAA